MLFGEKHKVLHQRYVKACKDFVTYFKYPLKEWEGIRQNYYEVLYELRIFLDENNCRMPRPVKFYDHYDKSTWTFQK